MAIQPRAPQAALQPKSKTPPSPNPSAEKVWPWLFPFQKGHITQFWAPPHEYGIDIGLPMGTPITSLTDGRVLGVGYPKCPGGVVSVESLVDGRMKSVYYQHLDVVVVRPGDQVRVGQVLAYSGGQLSGGHHPAERMCSSGPHIEIGLNAPWGGVWHPLGPNENPLPWLQKLIGSPISSPAGRSWSAAAATGRRMSAGNAPGFLGLEETFSSWEQLIGVPYNPPQASLTDPLATVSYSFSWVGSFIATNALTLGLRLMFVVLGALLVLGALNAAWESVITTQAGEQMAQQAKDQAGDPREGAKAAAEIVASNPEVLAV